MTGVAVVAHNGKSFGGGLPELRRLLANAGVTDPQWYEVPKSKRAPKVAEKALENGADLLLVWGGDGTVQRVVDAVAGSGVALGILPAGTANLFASNLGIPTDLPKALEIALHGARRELDAGVLNGEHFAVMAGAGFDAVMIDRADGALKDRLGRLAYVYTGTKATRQASQSMKIKVDGNLWFEGRASCVLMGQMGTLTGGMQAFPDADPADGQLEIGVVTADGPLQWARVVGRLAVGTAERSPLTRMTKGRKVDVRLSKKTMYELDGGSRTKVRRLKAKVERRAVVVCVPDAPSESATS
jgi:YegS/Rv2252/BmrU family lipid kinase